MVFVPMRRAQAAALRDGRSDGSGPWVGHAGTDALRAAHQYGPSMTEDADYSALCYAGVRALVATSETLRLVVAFDLPASTLSGASGDPYGEVNVLDLQWTQVTALFADEPASADRVRAARVALGRGVAVAQAMELPVVVELVDEADLLWFAPTELDSLPS